MAEPVQVEESVAEVLARYDKKGFSGQFSSRPDAMVHCHACGDDSPSEQVPVQAMHRLEGATDPEDETVVAALECPACGGLGTLVLPYGPGAGPEDAAVLAALQDDRDQSTIRPGL